MRQHPGTLAAAFVSTCLSYGAQFLNAVLPDLGRFNVLPAALPGIIFGLVVLVRREAGVPRNAGIVIVSGIVYWAAESIASALAVDWSQPVLLACALVGAASALALSFACRSLLHVDSRSEATVLATVIGTVAGIVLGLAFKTSESVFQVLFFASYLIWQTGFALAHELVPAWWPWRQPPEIRL